MKKCNVIMRHFSVVALAMIISLSLTSVTSIAASKKMTLNKSSATLKLGSTLQLKASNAGSTVKWSSDNKKVATVKDGLVTAKGVGVTQIKAVSNKVTVSCKITVYKPADKVTLKADLDYIEIGDIFEVNAIFSPKNATYQDLTWSVTSDDYWYPAIIQISDNRFEAQFDGTATIIAYQKETNKTYKLKLEVKEELGSFHIEYNNKTITSLEMNVGTHKIINADMDNEYHYFLYKPNPEFKYKTADPKIAVIDQRGQITALAKGETKIIVTAMNGKSMECSLKVNDNKETYMYDSRYADQLTEPVGIGNYAEFDYYSGPDNIYIYQLNSKQLGVFQHLSDKNSQYLKLYRYTNDFKYIDQQTIPLPYKEWGGLYQGEDGNYYAAVGQKNLKYDNAKIVFTIIKFNSDFKEVARCNINGAQSYTALPYDTGHASMTMDGTTLIVHTDRLRYLTEDGMNHQSNISFMIDTTDMSLLYAGAIFPYNHAGHSMNQIVKMDGRQLIYIDHGDAYPRSLVLQTHYNFSPTGWSDDYSNRPNIKAIDLIPIVGKTGWNYTGLTVSGLEIGKNNNIVAGVSVAHDKIKEDQLQSVEVRNVYVSLIAKDGASSKLLWLTDYKEGAGISTDMLRLVKINEDKFALLYQIVKDEDLGTGLIIIDSKGNVLDRKEYDFYYSGCVQPIYFKDSILWVESRLEDIFKHTDEGDFISDKCRFLSISLK